MNPSHTGEDLPAAGPRSSAEIGTDVAMVPGSRRVLDPTLGSLVGRVALWAGEHWSADLVRDIGQTLAIGIVYYLAASLSLRVALVGGQVTPIWPPTGIALVGLLIFGRKVWPGIAMGAFLVNAPIGPSLLTAGGVAVGNTLAPLLCATLLQRVGFRQELDRLHDAVAIVLLGALSMTLSATGGTTSLVLSGSVPLGRFWPTWSVWWTGDAMGVLVVAPFLLSLRWAGARSGTNWRRRTEAGVLFGGLLLVAYLVFQSRAQVEYLVFPFLVWAALRFRQGGAALAALLASVSAISAAVNGTGPFATGTLLEKMLTLHVFNATAALATLVTAAIITERAEHIAERRRAEDELARRALHDPLTGLANRALFMNTLGQALARADRHRSSVAVLFLDLDRFKVINDSLGHVAGDWVLIRMAERLRAVLRPGDTASRFGGDEFVILCEDIESEQHPITIAARLARVVAEPIELDAGEVVVTTSIGIAIARSGADSPETLVRDADAAVYRAKERGRARHELFDNDMRFRAVNRLRTESELRRAIEAGHLRLHYQPLVRLDDQRMESVEALVRWKHPERGLLAPEEFIPVAEETGLIAPLGSWVLEEACRQAAAWGSADGDKPTPAITVNLSARQLARPDFGETVERVLAQTDVAPSRLSFEITETVLMDAASSTIDILGRLRELGVRLVIDDFGTGYSSLNYLKRFQVDALKVDRSFVSGLGRDPEDSAIVAAVVSLAHALGLSAVAEGVETEKQLVHLRGLHCDLAQGFYFAHPQPAETLGKAFGLRSAVGAP